MAYVFVYGSLKRGYGNHHWLEDIKAEYVDTVKAKLPFRMVSYGAYPALVESDTHEITGEIFKINYSDINHLDTLEGYPEFYTRRREEVTPTINAWVYYLNPKYNDAKDPTLPAVESGIW